MSWSPEGVPRRRSDNRELLLGLDQQSQVPKSFSESRHFGGGDGFLNV